MTQKSISFVFCTALGIVALLTAPAAAQKPEITPGDAIREARIEPRMGETIPLDLTFSNEEGKTVRLGDYFEAGRPVLLTPVYYECPMLCNLVLNGLVRALKILSFTAGEEFEIVTFSIDPEETPDLAGQKKEIYLEEYDRSAAKEGWHFLTGGAEAVTRLTEAIGFHYARDEATGEFAHAAAIMMLTPEGKLSHYFYGIEFAPKDLRLAIIEASKEKIGNFVDQVLLLCYHYDPSTGKYGFAVMNALRIGGAMTILILGTFIFRALKTERQTPKKTSV